MNGNIDQCDVHLLLDQLNLEPENSVTIDDIIKQTIIDSKTDDPFYICDIMEVIRKYQKWCLCMPRIKPFFAIKCNPNPLVLEVLSALGTGFDCASKAEIETMLSIGAKPCDIIYANTCKSGSFIRYAAEVGVDLMTFDNELEVYKVRELHPNARMVLRIKADDSHSSIQLSDKFGADLANVPKLLKVAKNIGVDIVGVSFHVGTGCKQPSVYSNAIANAKHVIDLGREMGFNMTIVDLGGGYPGTEKNSYTPYSIEETALAINEALDLHFPAVDEHGNKSTIEIIAEPGQYFVSSAFTLATNIIAKKNSIQSNDTEVTKIYYLSEGMYGSFSLSIFDIDGLYDISPISIDGSTFDNRVKYKSTLWGPSCSSIDYILKNVNLPELNIGEWLIFRDMGAYTISLGCEFNGFKLASIVYYLPENERKILRQLPNWNRIATILEKNSNLN